MQRNEYSVNNTNSPAQIAPVATIAPGFDTLGLSTPILKAVADEGYTTPTPIQLQSIPHVITGRDLLGIAQTGTGKTAAFALPILHRLMANQQRAGKGHCRVLVLSPTRELSGQIADSFRAYGRELPVRGAIVYGGVSFGPQARQLQSGVDVVVATPGRLLDHLGQGTLRLDRTEIFVLDEADQMLDLGFMRDIRKIIALLPAQRQNLFFSATMPREIGALADELLKDPVRVAVTPVATTASRVEQKIVFCEAAKKRQVLVDLLRNVATERTLVFARTKRGADRIVEHLERAGLPAGAIHGNKSQSQRERALGAFRAGSCRVLVATDIAARGIDVDAVGHVINFDLPNVAESYVHRIGRTARAGATGTAISLCAPEERGMLRDIERLIRKQIPRLDAPAEAAGARKAA
ncbi:MAG: DEAD/DEAH box helicase [Alphaproteobacteria bacterium]|nr:DEAD/DEAH box helicase [Alphaproteobacteria bacterium]